MPRSAAQAPLVAELRLKFGSEGLRFGDADGGSATRMVVRRRGRWFGVADGGTATVVQFWGYGLASMAAVRLWLDAMGNQIRHRLAAEWDGVSLALLPSPKQTGARGFGFCRPR